MARNRRASASRADVFISHSSLDRVFAEKLVDVLKRHGIAASYVPDRLSEGKSGMTNRASVTALQLVSRDPVGERLEFQWVKRELNFALIATGIREQSIRSSKAPQGTIGHCPGHFPRSPIDFSGDFDEACVELLRVWGIVYQPLGFGTGLPSFRRPTHANLLNTR